MVAGKRWQKHAKFRTREGPRRLSPVGIAVTRTVETVRTTTTGRRAIISIARAIIARSSTLAPGAAITWWPAVIRRRPTAIARRSVFAGGQLIGRCRRVRPGAKTDSRSHGKARRHAA